MQSESCKSIVKYSLDSGVEKLILGKAYEDFLCKCSYPKGILIEVNVDRRILIMFGEILQRHTTFYVKT